MDHQISLDHLTHPDARAFLSAPDPATVLVDLAASQRLPEILRRLQGIPQPAEAHPEGDVWTHTLLVVTQAARLARTHVLNESENIILRLAALTHDLGKITTTVVEPDGRVRSWKHEQADVFLPLYRELAQSWNLPSGLESTVQCLVLLHLPNAVLQKQAPTDREVRQFLKKLESAGVPFRLARLLIAADQSGRNRGEFDPLAAWEPLIADLSESRQSRSRSSSSISGDDLIALGIPPGPRFRSLLAEAVGLEAAGRTRDEILTHFRASADRSADRDKAGC